MPSVIVLAQIVIFFGAGSEDPDADFSKTQKVYFQSQKGKNIRRGWTELSKIPNVNKNKTMDK